MGIGLDIAIHHFNPKLYTKLVTDTSKLNGFGFILVQTASIDSNTLISVLQCGLRSLSDAERNYSIIELECLAIQWALAKCDFFLHGLEDFSVITDHYPLVGVFNKPLSAIKNPQLVQIWEKKLLYSFSMSWMAGKHNEIANTFSRNQVSD